MAAAAADKTSAPGTGTAGIAARTASRLGTSASSAARPSNRPTVTGSPQPTTVSAAANNIPNIYSGSSSCTQAGWVSLWLLCRMENRRRELHGLQRRRRRPGVSRGRLELPRLWRPQLCVPYRVLPLPGAQVRGNPKMALEGSSAQRGAVAVRLATCLPGFVTACSSWVAACFDTGWTATISMRV